VILRGRLAFSGEELTELCQRHQVRELALFGSVLRDDFREDSDIDVLVEFEPGARVGLFEFIELKEELATLFGREVDLVSKGGLRWFNREQVLDSAELVYSSVSGYREPRGLDQASSRAAASFDRDLLRLHVAAEACAGIADLIDGAVWETLETDDLRQSAALFELHRLGEVLNRLSPELRAHHSDIPWQQLIDAGRRTVEDYRNTRWDAAREIMTTLVPQVHDRNCLILETRGSQHPQR
jgi:hypothetical protein